jgi:hypothetical protein
VSYATRRDAEGRKLDNLADGNQSDVESTLKAIQETKRREHQPIELKRRDGTSVTNEQDATPVPSIAVQPPALPALPPPGSEPDRNVTPNPQPENSLPPQNPQNQSPNQK